MVDLADTLAVEAAKEIVKVLAGLIETVKKAISTLWQRVGSHKQALIEAEVERSAIALQDAGDDLPAQALEVGVWVGRLRDLLAEHPEAEDDLRAMLEVLRGHAGQGPRVNQEIIAIAGGVAQGAYNGDVVNYNYLAPQPATPTAALSLDVGAKARADSHD